MVAPFQPDPEKIAALRAELPATGAGIQLDTATAGPLPLATSRVMRELDERESRVGRADRDSWLDALERRAEARAVVAALLGAAPGEVALTHGAREALAAAAWAPAWRPGDRAVTTDGEHPAALAPLLALRDRAGVELIRVELGDGHDAARLLDAFAAAITPGTRLVAVPHVAWATGLRLPVAEIGALARRVGAWFAVDGAQAAGAIPVDVPGLGADFYAVPGHTWLLGPAGIGALWASPRAIAGAADGDAHSAATPDARRFESGGLSRPSVAGLARSVGWLEMAVGLAWAHPRAARLARAAAERLAAISGVTLLTPLAAMGTLVAFRVAGWPARLVSDALARRVFAVTRAFEELDAVRVSVGWFNTEEELRRFGDAVAEIAAHTPASLPRRPELIVLTDA